MIVCAGRNETFPFATPLGVGLIESAMNFTQLCLFNKPDYIVFVGSAGSYGDHNIFDIVESSSAANIELSFFTDDSYTPLDNVIKTNNKTLRDDTIVNSSNYITTSEVLSKEFKQYGIGIENMEFFSLCQVAKEFEIPVAGIFIVTNYTNKNAHEDFKKNHQEAMYKLIDYLKEKKLIQK
ncbi:MAG TPA: purine-nucleoside phosphorylase [Arcobacter sp.]|nr:purine-nucleoside phosphorylase [Arcobacter sp.]HIP55856.1 purine-nucleoside phosphorylase [Arcobacter sp.]